MVGQIVPKNEHDKIRGSVLRNRCRDSATAILQGRMGSTRLPGKVMLPLVGKPIIQHVYERILRCRNIDRIVVATTTNQEDDAISQLFEGLGAQVFRGSASDPLDRYYRAATLYRATHVVRIMADCPLVDPCVVDTVIEHYFSGRHDFCCLGGEFPTGLDTTVFSYSVLQKCWENARQQSEREHVTPYITNHPNEFDIGTCKIFKGLYSLRWVMDYKADYEFMTEIYEALYEPGKIFLSRDVCSLLEMHPHLIDINAGIPRDEGIRRAIAQERDAG